MAEGFAKHTHSKRSLNWLTNESKGQLPALKNFFAVKTRRIPSRGRRVEVRQETEGGGGRERGGSD